jgi:hypothetical protein
VLEFLCPNGHKIQCPAEQAGRAARCPQCGVRFRIPEPADVEIHKSSSKGFRDPPPKSGSKAAAKPAPPRSPSPDEEDLMEFLCPNGHRLHGPSSLQGHHGECPACGAKFRIPAYEDAPEEEKKKPKGKIRLVETDEQEAEESPAKPQAAHVSAVVDQPLTAVADSEARLTEPGHPLAELFSKLWAERPKRSSVELHFADGQTLVPVHFARTLSREGYGVFTVEESAGTHTLTVVAWDSVVRVLIRGVEELPKEMVP